MPSRLILSVCPWARWLKTAKWCKYFFQYMFANLYLLISHCPRTSVKLHWVQFIRTTRPYRASSGRSTVNASLERAAHSIMDLMREDDSLTRCLTFLKVSPCHPCPRNWKRHATIINIRIIITPIILLAASTIPLISLAIIHTSSIFHPISTWATILASKTQWFK